MTEIIDFNNGMTYIYTCDRQRIYGTISLEDGTYEEGLSVSIKNGDISIISGQTDSEGVFDLSFYLPEGIYFPKIKCGNNVESISQNGIRSLACSLELSSDKNTIFMKKNDSATISATLKCSETDVPLPDREVTFKIKKNDTVIQTLKRTTNSSGVAEITYQSQGLQDITFTAEIGNIASESITIRDLNLGITTLSLSADTNSMYTNESVVLSGSLKCDNIGLSNQTIKLYKGETLLCDLITDSNGEFSETVGNLNAGTYNFKATFAQTEEYESSDSNIITVTVSKKQATLSLSAEDSSIFIEEDLILNGMLMCNNTPISGASVKLYKGETLISTLTTGSNGGFQETVSDLVLGQHTFKAVYNGDILYESSESSNLSVSVSKYSTQISYTIPQNLVYSDEFNISPQLTDQNNNPLENMTLKLVVDNVETAEASTNSEGVASFTQTPVRTGIHNFKITYGGNEKYNGTNSSVIQRDVSKETSVLTLTNPNTTTHYVNDDINVGGSLLENDGVVMKNKSIDISDNTSNSGINIDSNSITTDNSGLFSKIISYSKKGTKELVVSYSGDSNYTASTASKNLTLLQKTPVITASASESEIYVDESVIISGTLKYNNNAIKNHSIKIYNGETLVDTITTGNDGSYSKTINGLSAGDYVFKAVSVETDEYESVTSGNVSVSAIKHTTSITLTSPADNSSHYVNDDISVAGSLLENENIVMSSKTIGISDNGSVTTGNDASFSKTISYDIKGNKTLTISYAGDDTYKPCSITRFLTLLQKTPVVTIAGSESEIYTDESITISGTLKYNNNAVKNHSVKIYQGETLIDTLTTGNDGSYSKTINGLSAGTYLFKAVSVETNEYESVTSSNVSVEVFNVIVGVSIESDKSIISGYHSEVCTLTAKLIDSDGAVVTKDNLNITFKKNGTAIGSAVATTDGIATKTFNASNGGELELRADYSTFHDTCTVEDIYYYTDGKTDLNNWETILGVQITYTSNGIKATSNVNTINRPKLNITLPDYYSVEAKVTEHYINDGTTGLEVEGATLLGIPDYVQSTFEGGTAQEAARVSPALANGDVLKLVYTGNNVSSYLNNTFIVGRIADSVYDGIRLRTYNRRSITLTDFKIRRLDLGSVLLASDKSILSYDDGETCTLSATVKDSNGDAITVAGIGVNFYNGATLLGTSYTNANGVATYTYTSTGVGDIVLSAKIGNNITSNTITIEDIIKYIATTTVQKASDTTTQYMVKKVCDYDNTIIEFKGTFKQTSVSGTFNTGMGFASATGEPILKSDVEYALVNSAYTNTIGSGYFHYTAFTEQKRIRFTVSVNVEYELLIRLLHDNRWYCKITRLSDSKVLYEHIDTIPITITDYELMLWSFNNVVADWKDVKVKHYNVGSVVLTSDKTILSYEDSDSCTLTATLENGQGVPASAGIPVSFYNGATLLGTSYTNNNGVATYSYTSTGAGDIVLSAKAGNNITSNNLNIEDCHLFENPSAENAAKYSGTLNFSYNSNGYYELNSNASHGQTIIRDLGITIAEPVQVSVESLKPDSGNVQLCWALLNSSNNGKGVRRAGSQHVSQSFTNGTRANIKVTNYPTALAENKWYKTVFDLSSTNVNAKYYDDGTLVNSFYDSYNASIADYSKVRIICDKTNNTNSFYWKNLKIKAFNVGEIVLTSDKTILSYDDSDSCTLTATLENGQGVPASAGIPVSFYNGETLLGTAYTNNNGVATYTYTSTGVGDMTVTAKAGNNITSNSINIEDLTKYDPCTTDSGNWNIASDASITFDSTDGAYIIGTAAVVGYSKYNITYPTGDYSVEATVTKTTYDGSYVLTRMGVNGVFVDSKNKSNNIKLVDDSFDPPGITQSPKLEIGDVLKFVYDSTNNEVTVYRNNTLVGAKAITTGYEGIQFRSYSGRGLGIKNLKIKPL